MISLVLNRPATRQKWTAEAPFPCERDQPMDLNCVPWWMSQMFFCVKGEAEVLLCEYKDMK